MGILIISLICSSISNFLGFSNFEDKISQLAFELLEQFSLFKIAHISSFWSFISDPVFEKYLPFDESDINFYGMQRVRDVIHTRHWRFCKLTTLFFLHLNSKNISIVETSCLVKNRLSYIHLIRVKTEFPTFKNRLRVILCTLSYIFRIRSFKSPRISSYIRQLSKIRITESILEKI